jgi:hypothetical protein
MNVHLRKKLDMAERVLDFCGTHPDPNPGYTDAVARLGERVGRAHALAKQEVAGRLAVTGAVANKEELRQEIQQVVAMLAGLAASAIQEEPDLRALILRPTIGLSHQAFLTRSRVAADVAEEHKEILTRYGMLDDFLTGLRSSLDRFEQVLNEKHLGRAAHVGARAELEAVMAEIMLIVRQLDALNRYRFRKDAESLAAWKSARDVAWPLSSTGDEAEKPAA